MSFDEEHIDPHGECAHEISKLREALLIAAPSHQGGHSATGHAISEALDVPFPITMDALILRATRAGHDPDKLWPWCVQQRGKSLKLKTA